MQKEITKSRIQGSCGADEALPCQQTGCRHRLKRIADVADSRTDRSHCKDSCDEAHSGVVYLQQIWLKVGVMSQS